jgi:hypothetical protein
MFICRIRKKASHRLSSMRRSAGIVAVVLPIALVRGPFSLTGRFRQSRIGRTRKQERSASCKNSWQLKIKQPRIERLFFSFDPWLFSYTARSAKRGDKGLCSCGFRSLRRHLEKCFKQLHRPGGVPLAKINKSQIIIRIGILLIQLNRLF